MAEEGKSSQKKMAKMGASSSVYGVGLIGALFYFIGHSTTFGMGVMGFLKAIVWPALLVYKLLGFFKM